jgi:hypothetical protein
VVCIAMMFEIIVSLIILSVRSHKGFVSYLLVLVEGFHLVHIVRLSPHILITRPSCFVVMGLLGLKHLVSLRIVSLRYGFVHVIDVCIVGSNGCYAKGIS